MLPEIDKRCLDCGATARRQAKFCPQCGADFGGEAKDGNAISVGASAENELTANVPPTRETEAFPQNSNGGQAARDSNEARAVPFTREVEVPFDAKASSPDSDSAARVTEPAQAYETSRGHVPVTREVEALREGETSNPLRESEASRVAPALPPTIFVGENGAKLKASAAREMSEQLLEKASVDPNARLVLVAALLFAVFLVLLLLHLYLR